jgi:hypothetical protein
MRARLSAGAVRCDWLVRESLAACRSAVAPEGATQSHARGGPRRARACGSRWTCGEPGPGRSSCVPTRLDPVSPHERFPPPFPRPPESRSRLLLCGGCTPRHEKNSAGRSSTVCKSSLSVRPRFAAELPSCTPVRERGRFRFGSGDGSFPVQGTVPFRFRGRFRFGSGDGSFPVQGTVPFRFRGRFHFGSLAFSGAWWTVRDCWKSTGLLRNASDGSATPHTDLVRRLPAAVGTPHEVDDEPVTGRVQIRW